MLVVFSGYSTNKTNRHDITEILLKVALNTIAPTPITSVTHVNVLRRWLIFKENTLHVEREPVLAYSKIFRSVVITQNQIQQCMN